MTIHLGGYTLEGPYASSLSLKRQAGVYAILATGTFGSYRVIDVGESHLVKDRVETHERRSCWRRQSSTGLYYCAHYAPGLFQMGRIAIERQIRARYKPPCGED